MYVTGATERVRGESRRGTGHVGKTGRQRTSVTQAGGSARADGAARAGGATRAGGIWSGSHGGWHRVTGWSGWRRVARELVLVAVFAAVYEYIGKNMVQA